MWSLLDSFSKYLSDFCIEVLKCGPIPQHIAIIVDGNRRYAKQRNKKSIFGHRKGSETLKNLAKCTQNMGIKQLTLYGFSIENFKRNKEEIKAIFDLMEELMIEIVEDFPNTEVRLAGNLDLLPRDFLKTMSEYSLKSADGNKEFLVNVALAYTARDEITNVIKLMGEGVRDGHLTLEDIDEDLFNQCLYIESEPDILIRTSGEVRFSDFLLWQIRSSHVNFLGTLWPDFNIWMLMACVFKYQADLKSVSFRPELRREDNARKVLLVEHIHRCRLQKIKEYANG